MFEFSSIERYHQQLRDGATNCVDTVRYYLRKISETTHLNAFIDVYADEALARAGSLDKKRTTGSVTGKLHGVVIGIKDVICYKDHKLTAASAILKDFSSLYSATAVQRLIDEEAIIIGNLNCDEFAMGSSNENSVYGPTMNAFDTSRVPGGSSGGSAVAVQAGLCMASLGSDTGGSVRQPAEFCGIFGFKPSYGRISRYGLVAYASSFDQIGVFGKSVEDIARIYECMAGPDEFDSTVSKKHPEPFSPVPDEKKYRFAYFKSALEHPAIDPLISKPISQFIRQLEADGHVVEPVPFELIDYVVPAYYILTTAEASSNLSRYDGVRFGSRYPDASNDLTSFYKMNRSAGFGTEVKRRIMLGSFVLSAGYYEAYYSKAQQVRALLCEQVDSIFNTYDIIILPNSPVLPWKAGEKNKDLTTAYLADIYTVLANLTGIPAISIPLFKQFDNLSSGIQLLANRMNDLSLLHVSHFISRKYPIKPDIR